MERITTLLQKIKDISGKNGDLSVIEVDLMLDYTKVMYADLLEIRNRVYFNGSLAEEQTVTAQERETVLPAPSTTAEHTPDRNITRDQWTPQAEVPTTNEMEQDAPAIAELSLTPEKHAFVSPKASPTGQDIRKYIAINDKFLFINELFNGDANAYEAVLNELNNHPNYLNAVSWLDETHSLYHWDDEHPTVVSFYAVVSHFFASM